MDVELRMIRQKNLGLQMASQQEEIEEEEGPSTINLNNLNQELRSKAFSHIEQITVTSPIGSSIGENSNTSGGSDERSLQVQKKAIDMGIIERIKNMRSKSRDPSNPEGTL
jgi:hypothetical protein